MTIHLQELNESEIDQVSGGGVLDNLLNSLIQGNGLGQVVNPVLGVVGQVTGVVGSLLGTGLNIKLGQ